ncbi:MAG: hypothetical protein H0U43_04325 [Chthoniobacterales bacterium]|nr:hypothetical protein [Chthoniobacterales bacterium]
MNPEHDDRSVPASRVPRGGWFAMAFILLVMGMVSIYSNVQKSRRDITEKVTITPAASITPAPVGPDVDATP